MPPFVPAPASPSVVPYGAEPPWRRHATFVLVALAYLCVWPYFERLNNPNENVRVWMTRAIVEHHTLAIDRVSAEWGYVNDKAVDHGRIYSSKAPGASFAGVPVLWAETKLWHAMGWASPSKHAATASLRLFTVMLPSILFLFFFSRWVEARTRSPVARDLLLVATGAGTMLLPYGILFVGHAQAAIAGFASFMLLAPNAGRPDPNSAIPSDDPPPAPLRFAAAGALAGMAVMLEYQLLLVAVLLTILVLWTAPRRILFFLVGALPFALALGAYHTALFGHPWEFPYGHLENQDYAQIHGVGYHGLAGPRLVVLTTALFSVSYGLFAYAPFLALGLALGGYAAITGGRGGVFPARARREGLLAVAAMLVMTLFISGLANWRAGWCVGPRYIAAAVPFLALGFVATWPLFEGLSRRTEALRALAGGLIISAVFANGISAAVYPHYPEVFDNPIFDLTLPLLREGYTSYGLGWALGWRGVWALLPVALLLGLALTVAIAGHAPNRRRAGLRLIAAAIVALAFSGAISRYGRGPSAAEAVAGATVRALWEPPSSRPSGAPPPR